MGTPASLPSKEDLPKQLWELATTLTTESQSAGLKRAKELGFDLERGRISLEETLINLNHARCFVGRGQPKQARSITTKAPVCPVFADTAGQPSPHRAR